MIHCLLESKPFLSLNSVGAISSSQSADTCWIVLAVRGTTLGTMLKVLRKSLFSGSNLKQEPREGATIHYWSQGMAQFSEAVPGGFCPPVEETARLLHLCHEEYALASFHHQKSQASSIDLVLEKQVDRHHLYLTGDFISCWTEQIVFPARLASQLPGSYCWNIIHSHCSLFISAAHFPET